MSITKMLFYESDKSLPTYIVKPLRQLDRRTKFGIKFKNKGFLEQLMLINRNLNIIYYFCDQLMWFNENRILRTKF